MIESILGCLSDLKYGDNAPIIEIAEANKNFKTSKAFKRRTTRYSWNPSTNAKAKLLIIVPSDMCYRIVII
jgi:hypothetical protein